MLLIEFLRLREQRVQKYMASDIKNSFESIITKLCCVHIRSQYIKNVSVEDLMSYCEVSCFPTPEALFLGRRDEKRLSRLAFGEGRRDENSCEADAPPRIPFVITAIIAERLGFANIL